MIKTSWLWSTMMQYSPLQRNSQVTCIWSLNLSVHKLYQYIDPMFIPPCFYCNLETRDFYINSIYSTISVATKKLYFNPLMATTGSQNLEKRSGWGNYAKSCSFLFFLVMWVFWHSGAPFSHVWLFQHWLY